ncbi:MAG: hypothetical protein E3J70_03025 [Candidatus Heimdallarchaeota archaeon]|nr:MAG: hypothetical protein E3J70_03025 [Candidatus Heimdallarchaeota archaeon]
MGVLDLADIFDDYRNPQKLAQLIKESASVLEHRITLLNFDNSLLFVKVMPEHFENMGTKFSNFLSN